MNPRSTPEPPVAVEYDSRGGTRVTKIFTDAYVARRFYIAKLKAGRNPRVRKPQET